MNIKTLNKIIRATIYIYLAIALLGEFHSYLLSGIVLLLSLMIEIIGNTVSNLIQVNGFLTGSIVGLQKLSVDQWGHISSLEDEVAELTQLLERAREDSILFSGDKS